jgi:hypothetical protein
MVSMHEAAIILNGKHQPVAEPVPIRAMASVEQAHGDTE